MRIINLFNTVSSRGLVVTIGNFDGVHLGHQALFKAMSTYANERNFDTAVILFEPQPLEVISNNPPCRILSLREKAKNIKSHGINSIICINFRDVQNLTDESFVDNILVNKLKIQAIFAGKDFVFGKNKTGNINTLRQNDKFKTIINEDVLISTNKISSTLIRNALLKADFTNAAKMLGFNFYLQGRVVNGRKLARTLDVPTANIALKQKTAPVFGVYVVEVFLNEAKLYGVANVGFNPTVTSSKQLKLEVHILNFNQDIYGKCLKVVFKAKIRDEAKFNSVEELKQAMKEDIKITQLFLKNDYGKERL